MFGFGKSPLEQALLQRAVEMCRMLGAEEHAPQLLEQAKQATKQVCPDLETTSFGNSMIQNQAYVKAREAYGLSSSDIQAYWNQGLFLRMLDDQFRQLVNFTSIQVLESGGLSMDDAARAHYKNAPKYGNPDSWDDSLPINIGLTIVDAPIPTELEERVHAWDTSIPEEEKVGLMAEYTTFNAMVRDLIKQRKL